MRMAHAYDYTTSYTAYIRRVEENIPNVLSQLINHTPTQLFGTPREQASKEVKMSVGTAIVFSSTGLERMNPVLPLSSVQASNRLNAEQ